VVTAIARTLADCLRCFGPRVSVPLADHALHEGMCTWEEVRSALAAQRRWRGRPRALEALLVVDGRRETWLESYAFMSLRRWGIDLPIPQVIVRDDCGAFVARVDGGWLEDLTVFEVDGRGKYELGDGQEDEPDEDGAKRRSAFFREKSRHNDIGNLGLVVVRCELADLRYRSDALIRHIQGQRAAGRRARFRGEFEVLDAAGLAPPAIQTHDTPGFVQDAGSESGVS
jgi:hypothetical protein